MMVMALQNFQGYETICLIDSSIRLQCSVLLFLSMLLIVVVCLLNCSSVSISLKKSNEDESPVMSGATA
jgi:hypothetical protein